MIKYAMAFAVMISAGPVFAQGATQTPPAPSGSESQPQSSNSLPPGAANMNLNSTQNPNLAGQALGGTSTVAPTGTATTTRP